MKESAKNRTEYQIFLHSLFVKYGIESPDESWSNSVWKVIVNSRLSDFDRENFYKELSDYNIKNPSDENWTHKIDEKLEKDGQEVKAEIVKEEKFEKSYIILIMIGVGIAFSTIYISVFGPIVFEMLLYYFY